jgi:surface carbohydrate biosynthesis protein
MKFSKYITYLKEIILETKFVFSKPKKTQVLLYDQGTKFNEQIKKTLKKKSVSILYARLEEINLYVLFKTLIKLKFFNGKKLFLNYLLEYCKIVEPNWIVTSIYWDLKFFKLKKDLNRKIKFAIVQGVPFYKGLLPFTKKKQDVDFFFCYDEVSKKNFNTVIEAKFIEIGSFRSNFYPKEKKKNSKDILFISGFRENFLNTDQESIYFKNIKQEKVILSYLNKFTKEININFKILLKPNVETKNYSDHFQISKDFLIYNNGENAYKTLDNFAFILLTNYSAMCFEAAARGLKYAIIPIHSHPENNLKEKNFNIYFGETDYLNIKNFLIKINDDTKESFFKKYKQTYTNCIFDEENRIFRSYIEK